MDQSAGGTLKIGAWRVSPSTGQISRQGETEELIEETYDRQSENILKAQDEIAGEVVKSLERELSAVH